MDKEEKGEGMNEEKREVRSVVFTEFCRYFKKERNSAVSRVSTEFRWTEEGQEGGKRKREEGGRTKKKPEGRREGVEGGNYRGGRNKREREAVGRGIREERVGEERIGSKEKEKKLE